jgi:sortase (surface protein transpeptidase)
VVVGAASGRECESRSPILHCHRRIGLGVMIMEGIDDRTLRRAGGHIPGTPLPGQLGNVAIAGHWDTFSDRYAISVGR